MDVAEGRYPEITDGATPWTMKQVLIARKWESHHFEMKALGIQRGHHACRLRSLRRALAGLVDDGRIIAIGKPSDPHRRYVIHPHWFKEDDPRLEQIKELLYRNTEKIGEIEHIMYHILDHQCGFGARLLARLTQASEGA
jgi:hypothetical protein